MDQGQGVAVAVPIRELKMLYGNFALSGSTRPDMNWMLLLPR
jgi:hypothetical protein